MFKVIQKQRFSLLSSQRFLFKKHLNINQRHAYSTIISKERWLTKTNLRMAGAIGITFFGCYWFLYPHNNYPRSVSKPLRNALWQERKFKDFKTSIRFYMDALDECDRLEMDTVSNEYTGIEIKIAEMYEKLGDIDRANETYLHTLGRIHSILKSSKNITQTKRNNLIKRDLSLVYKIVTNRLSQENGTLNVTQQLGILESHMELVEEELYQLVPKLKDMIHQRVSPEAIPDSGKLGYEQKILGNVTAEEKMIKHIGKLFQPFKDEYFALRNLYTKLFLDVLYIDLALDATLVTLGWMVLADMTKSQLLLCRINVGALFFLKSIELHVDISNFPEFNKDPNITLDILRRQRTFYLDNSAKIYENVLSETGFETKETDIMQELKYDEKTLEAIGKSLFSLYTISVVQENREKEAEKKLIKALRFAQDFEIKQWLCGSISLRQQMTSGI